MNCPSCAQKFTETEVEPHILIACGHSICKSCLVAATAKAGTSESWIQVECPDCGVVSQAESLNYFPKNFALVNMVRTSMSSKEMPFKVDEAALQSPKHSQLSKLEDMEEKHCKS